MIDFKKFIKLNKVFILIALLIILLLIMPISYSIFYSQKDSNITVDAAYYVIDTNIINDTIKLDDIIPSEENYNYVFTISNYKDGYRSETDMEYDLVIKTTTNLPLNYSLYLNDDNQNIFSGDEIITDEDGMYFRKFTTSTKTLSHLNDEINTYTLSVNFPKTYEDSLIDYSVEAIIIEINSRQIIE